MYPSFSTWLLPSCHPVPPRCTTCPLPSPSSSSFQLSREVSAVGVDLAARVQPGICLCNRASSGGARQERRRQVDVSRWNIQTLSTNPDYISSLNTLSLIKATQQLQDVNINISGGKLAFMTLIDFVILGTRQGRCRRFRCPAQIHF